MGEWERCGLADWRRRLLLELLYFPPPPTKKKGRGGGLVVSKWHITKACLFTFRAEGAFKRRWGEGKGMKSTDWVTTAEAKSETEYFVEVDWVGVEDANVHLPFF